MEDNTEKSQVRGMPKSGKFWKTPKEKFRKIHRTMPKKSKDQHMKFRAELKRVKELSKSIKEERKQQNELKKQRREENLKRKQENEIKSQTVQIIKNTAKMKRIKKKHLRQIQKRDLDSLKSKIV